MFWWALSAAVAPPPSRRLVYFEGDLERWRGGAHSMAVEEGGRVINNEVARVPLQPHDTWQASADALAAAPPSLHLAW